VGQRHSLAHASANGRHQHYALAAALQWECSSKLEIHSAEQRLLRCRKPGRNTNHGSPMVIDDYYGEATSGLQMWLDTANGVAPQNWLLNIQ
jgi:hypothetical protein